MLVLRVGVSMRIEGQSYSDNEGCLAYICVCSKLCVQIKLSSVTPGILKTLDNSYNKTFPLKEGKQIVLS